MSQFPLPFPDEPEIKFLYMMFLYGYFGWGGQKIAKASYYPTLPPSMSIAQQLQWDDYITSLIKRLNEASTNKNSFQFMLNNSFLYNNMGEICGKEFDTHQLKLDENNTHIFKTSAELSTYVYLNCSEGNVLAGFTVLKVIEVCSLFGLYYLYAFIGVKIKDNERTFCVVFRGTSNMIQVVSDLLIFPKYETITINGNQFDVDSHTGFYKSMNDVYNNHNMSAFAVIMEELTTASYPSNHINGEPFAKTNLLITGHSLGAACANLFVQKFFTDETQQEMQIKYDEINVVTFGEPVSGKKPTTSIVNEYILSVYKNCRYYTVINNVDIVPSLDTLIRPFFPAHDKGVLIQNNKKALYTIELNNLSYGPVLNALHTYVFHFKFLRTGLYGNLMFFQIIGLLFFYTLYNHSILCYLNGLNEIL